MADFSNLFLKYQKDWIKDTSKFSICEKSRRIGISFAEAYRAVLTRISLAEQNKTEDYNYIAQVESTSIGFIQDCTKWGKVFNAIALSNNQPQPVNIEKATQLILPFHNGSKIVGYSSNADSLRSKGGSVTIDEAAFFLTESDEAAIIPLINTMGQDAKLRIISTHNGLSSRFNQLVNEAKQGKPYWTHHRVDIYDAVNQGFALKQIGPWLDFLPDTKKVNEEYIKFLKGSISSELVWNQEYECKPLASGSTLISFAQYDKLAIEEDTNIDITNKKFGNLYVGVDLGINDQTVIWIIEESYNQAVEDPNLRREYRTKAVKILKGVRTQEQQELIKQIVNHPAVIWCCIDMGTFGLTITEHVQKNTGKVEGISFGNPMKKVLAERVRDFIARERVSLPKNRNEIKEDVCCVQLTYTDSGNVSYGGRSSQGHADCYDMNTEILTNKGWKFFKDLNGEQICSLNKDNEIEYVDYVVNGKKIWNDKMIRIENDQIDLLITPTHRVHFRSCNANSKWQTKPWNEITTDKRNIKFKKNGIWNGINSDFFNLSKSRELGNKAIIKDNLPLSDFLFLIGFYIAEGNTAKGKIIRFYQNYNKELFDFLCAKIKNLGYNPGFLKRKDTIVGLEIHNTQLCEWINENIPKYSYNKRIPRCFFDYSKENLIHLYNGMMIGDGNLKYRNGEFSHTYTGKIYGTSSKGLADDFQELCLKLGLSCNIRTHDNIGRKAPNGFTRRLSYTCHVITSYNEPQLDRKKIGNITEEYYTGFVYDVQLERNHVLYVRRNGKACWSGNCFWALSLALHAAETHPPSFALGLRI